WTINHLLVQLRCIDRSLQSNVDLLLYLSDRPASANQEDRVCGSTRSSLRVRARALTDCGRIACLLRSPRAAAARAWIRADGPHYVPCAAARSRSHPIR